MRRLMLAGLAVFAFFGGLLAQTPDGAGIVPRGSYASTEIDTINLYNGNLILNIPVFSRPGRELSSGLTEVYNSRGWETFTDSWGSVGIYRGGFVESSPYGSESGAGVLPYLIDCDYSGYPYVDPTGLWGFDVLWVDGSGATHQYPMSTYSNIPAYGGCDELSLSSWYDLGGLWLAAATPDDNSMAYLDNSGVVVVYHGDGHLITTNGIETRNGNYEIPSGIFGDTLGRTIPTSFSTGSGTSSATYTLYDSSGTPRNYILNWNTCHTVYNSIDAHTQCQYLLTSIELPNGTSYDFEYGHDQGFLTKVTLPTGGYIAYDYEGGNSDHNPDHNYVVHRHVSDGTTVATWGYARSVSGTTRTVTVTDPEGHDVVHVFDGGVFETETEWREDAMASPTKTVTTTWTSGQPTTIVTELGSVKQQRTLTWTGPRVTASTQSDWYTGSTVVPLTQTITGYTSYTAPTNDLLPISVELRQWNGSSYVIQGKTEYAYDEYSLVSRSGSIPQHHSPMVSRRNNLTTVQRYYDATHHLDEHFYYDELGNVVEHADERGIITRFDFTDNYSDSGHNGSTYAYPKQVTVDPSGLNLHVATTKYSFDTGLPKSVADARGKTTTITYDLMNQPDVITDPNGGETDYDYLPTTRQVIEKVLVASGKYRTTETTMDGLGRLIQSKLSDPGGDVFVDSIYSDGGAVWKVSSPYRSGTPVWTQTDRDVLGRPVAITNPDSSTATYAYSDNMVTQTDEAGNQRRYTSNALGQLTKVEEPNPNLTSPLVTDYSYYVFGPLQQVMQTGSLYRTFTHDWLGRMTSEGHPENGTTAYTYDGSLVASRTDARGILTEYAYDDAGRPHTVHYHDGSTMCVDTTPRVIYEYDTGGYDGLLTKVTVSGVTESSFTYDDAGQLLSDAVTRNGFSGTFTTSYAYDLGGRLLAATYPSGRVVWPAPGFTDTDLS